MTGWQWDGPTVLVLVLVALFLVGLTAALRTLRIWLGRRYRRVRYGSDKSVWEDRR